ncbi:ChbG/HpnK family deacetylase [Nonomuraea sp. H19]|uniref:ChbG/HpnK family deacetylase n=1 Tax=Nonomuraea sp. H19 TaxID=3452206 RepID=UPI003F8ABEE8
MPGRPWGPPADKARVPSLLDETGGLYPRDRIPELLAHARLDEIEIEFRAQTRAVLDAGPAPAPAHLDWHCLADGGREDVFELTVAPGRRARPWRCEPGSIRLRRCCRDHRDRPRDGPSSLDRAVRLRTPGQRRRDGEP